MLVSHAWMEEGWAEGPAIFYSVVWPAVRAAGLSAPCVAVVSGSAVVQGGIFFL